MLLSNFMQPKDRIRLVLIVGVTVSMVIFTSQVRKLSSYNDSTEILGYDVTMNNNIKEPTVLEQDKIQNKKSIIKTNKGIIEIKLFEEDAPLTVSNHVQFTEAGFYNGLTFHRREEGFVIQGGDPDGNGTGGPGYNFKDEPVKRAYTKGIVAMANRGPNTNGSQFFIMLEDVPLPPDYTIFGEVISGIEVVEQIQVGDVMESVEIRDL